MTCSVCKGPGGRPVHDLPRSAFARGPRTVARVICPACESFWRSEIDDETAMLRGEGPGGALYLADDQDGPAPAPIRRTPPPPPPPQGEPPAACAGFQPQLALFAGVA